MLRPPKGARRDNHGVSRPRSPQGGFGPPLLLPPEYGTTGALVRPPRRAVPPAIHVRTAPPLCLRPPPNLQVDPAGVISCEGLEHCVCWCVSGGGGQAAPRPRNGTLGVGFGPVVMPWGQQVRAVTVTLNLGREGTPLQAAWLTSCHTFGLAYGVVAYQAPRAFHQDGVSTETLGWGQCASSSPLRRQQ